MNVKQLIEILTEVDPRTKVGFSYTADFLNNQTRHRREVETIKIEPLHDDPKGIIIFGCDGWDI